MLIQLINIIGQLARVRACVCVCVGVGAGACVRACDLAQNTHTHILWR
jgi:hypothetical protein